MDGWLLNNRKKNQFGRDKYWFVTSVFELFGNVWLGTFSPSWMKAESSNILPVNTCWKIKLNKTKLFRPLILAVFMQNCFSFSAPHKQGVKDRNLTSINSYCWLWMLQRCHDCHVQIAPILRLNLRCQSRQLITGAIFVYEGLSAFRMQHPIQTNYMTGAEKCHSDYCSMIYVAIANVLHNDPWLDLITPLCIHLLLFEHNAPPQLSLLLQSTLLIVEGLYNSPSNLLPTVN